MALPGVYKIFNDRWCNQTVFIISDTHFGDKELRAGMPYRPSDEELVRRINAKVGRKDTLILLGDVGDIEYVRQLRGYKVLICGNHDLGATRYKRQFIKGKKFDKCLYPTQDDVRKIIDKEYPGWNYHIAEDFDYPYKYWEVYGDNGLFDEVYEGALIVGEKLILSHEPVEIPWLYNIHGHDHAGCKRKNHLNVCSDVIGYEPVNLTQKLKSGLMSAITTIHRATIDSATERKAKRGGKKINGRT